MHLNTIRPAQGAKRNPKRVGRGIGSGSGKTCGKGHKGQHARAGGYHKLGFEGGQMPLQRRLPKFGFTSRSAQMVASVRLSALGRLAVDSITMQTLREAKLISASIKSVRVILSGKIDKALNIGADIYLTKGAKSAILEAGGRIES